MQEIIINNLAEIENAAETFLNKNKQKKHFAFYGEMGAGKTTFIKALCKKLQVSDVVSSPTFAIINEYHTLTVDKIFHFDFYRIKDIEEVYNIGYEDYFYGSDYCFIEWPELVEDILPDHMQKVKIQVIEGGARKISF